MRITYIKKVTTAEDFFKNLDECPCNSSMSSCEWKQMYGKGRGGKLVKNRLAKEINSRIMVYCPLLICWNLKFIFSKLGYIICSRVLQWECRKRLEVCRQLQETGA